MSRRGAWHGAMRAAAALAAVLLASCSTERPAPPPAPRPVVRPEPVVAPPRTPASYVAAAASIDLFVIRASETVIERSRDAAVLGMAQTLRDEHRGLAAQLSFAGRRIDALPSPHLLPREEQRLAALMAAPDIAASFARLMALTHRQSLALHAEYAARGTSPTLRMVAANAQRVERAHLARIGAR